MVFVSCLFGWFWFGLWFEVVWLFCRLLVLELIILLLLVFITRLLVYCCVLSDCLFVVVLLC